MAKAKTLAALAGLAGLAYAMRNKGESKTDTGDETDRLAARKPAPITDTGDETDRLLARSPTPDYSNEGRNKPLKVSPPVAPLKPTVAEDVIPTKPLATPEQRTDQLANLSRAVKREAKTKQFAADVPYQESAQKTDALAVASRAAAAADRRRKMAKQSAYKSGGMVSKVSSASSRADGIATKGKTRGKIC
jgi:hypothetical protein